MSAAKERPILFTGPMVRALLDGSKTQTRRIVKPRKDRNIGCQLAPSEIAGEVNQRQDYSNCPYGQPGDRLWVRETFYCDHCFYPDGTPDTCQWREVDGKRVPLTLDEKRSEMLQSIYYRADGEPEWEGAEGPTPWRPSIHMPRWASRIDLEITGVRVERLQDISEADCIDEGAPGGHGSIPGYSYAATPLEHYRHIWESIHGPGSWAANPWVWVVEFEKVKP